MNFKIVRNILSKILCLEAALMVIPLIVSFVYKEDIDHILGFGITIVILVFAGNLINIKSKGNTTFKAKEGFVSVGLSWILMSLFGALPFVISGDIPSYVDAFFEITSGLTTTGSSILTDIESLSHSNLFWRSFSHWIGGMGVLVFILALLPTKNQHSSMHLLRAESPGPQVGKLVSKMNVTARILYLMYICLTLIEFLILWIGPDPQMNCFHSITTAFATAGTGGFGLLNTGFATYTAFSQYVVAIFMTIFGINFSLFYLILIGKVKEAFKSEELRTYLTIIIVSVIAICINTFSMYEGFEETFRHSFFQVSSIITSTGMATVDFNLWPTFSKTILLIIMIFGACAGSTGGGLKISRLIIITKTLVYKIKKIVSPNKVETVKLDGKVVSQEVVDNTVGFFTLYIFVIIICALLISFDNFDITTNLSASLTCLSNIGPGLEIVGPMGNFSQFSDFSKIILSLEMVIGRLELFPILILFNTRTWRKY